MEYRLELGVLPAWIALALISLVHKGLISSSYHQHLFALGLFLAARACSAHNRLEILGCCPPWLSLKQWLSGAGVLIPLLPWMDNREVSHAHCFWIGSEGTRTNSPGLWFSLSLTVNLTSQAVPIPKLLICQAIIPQLSHLTTAM